MPDATASALLLLPTGPTPTRAEPEEGPLVPGSKLPASHENPVDALIIRAVDRPVDWLHALGVTPNAVTALSAVTSALSIFCFVRRQPLASGALWLVSYVLDCVDGLLARRHGLESSIGDLADHLTDSLAFVGLAGAVVWRILGDRALPRWPLAVEGVLLALSYVHMSCQQRGAISSTYIPVRGISGCACPAPGLARYTRWAGMGTLLIWHLVLIGTYARRG